MFAERHHRTRLRTFGAFGMLRDKTHLVSDGQLVETATGDAVTMEIDLGAIGGHDEAAILLGKQARDPPMIGYCMQLHIAAPLANVVFEQPAHGVKRVADGDMGVLVRVVRLGIAADDDLAAGNTEIYADAEQVALLAARMLAFDDDTAGYDPIEKAFELLGACADARRNRLRAVHVTKGDLKRDLHSTSPLRNGALVLQTP